MTDLPGLAVSGPEDDADDVASVMMIEVLFDPGSALDLVRDLGFGWAAEALLSRAGGEKVMW